MLRMIVRSDRIVNELGDLPPILSKFNRFQLEDGFIKHSQLAVSVGAGQAGAEVHGGLLPHVVQSLDFSGG